MRYTSPPPVDERLSALPSLPSGPNVGESNNVQQRIINLLGPPEVQGAAAEPNEAVSPVSSVEDESTADSQAKDTPTTPKASDQQRLNGEQAKSKSDNKEAGDQASKEAWQNGSAGIIAPEWHAGNGNQTGISAMSALVNPEILVETPAASANKATTSSDDKTKPIGEAAANIPIDAERMPSSPAHGGIAISDSAARKETEPTDQSQSNASAKEIPPIPITLLNQQGAFSKAVGPMEMKVEPPGSPSDELYEQPPQLPQNPVMTVTSVEGEKNERHDIDDDRLNDDKPTKESTLVASRSTGGRSMPSVSSISKSEQDDDQLADNTLLGPSHSTAARSVPSVSSMGREDQVSSIGDENTDVAPPSVSPVPPSFAERQYRGPDPSKERPMSFVELPRDPSGRPPQEEISVRSPRRGDLDQDQWLPSPPLEPGSEQRGSDSGAMPSPVHDTMDRTPAGIPPVKHAHKEPWSLKPGEERRFIGGVQLRRLSGQGISPPASQPRGDSRVMGQGKPPSLSVEGQPPTGSRGPHNRVGQVPSPIHVTRNASHQSVESPDGSSDKKKRTSAFLGAFKRPSSAGAESTFSKHTATSILAQASESPTRTQYLQDPSAPIGTIPPPSSEDPRKSKGSKKEASVVQRSSTNQDSGKKKRFSALGSIFGRSSSNTGNTTKTKLEKKAPQNMLQSPSKSSPSAFESMQQYQLQQSRNRDLPPLPRDALAPQPGKFGGPQLAGGYYAPESFNRPPASGIPTNNPSRQYGPGVVNYARLSQQQALEERQRQIDARNRSLSATGVPTGRHTSDSSTRLSPQISAGASPQDLRAESLAGLSSVSSISSRRESAPSLYGPGAVHPADRGPRMGSISEHQERPWAISLPATEHDDTETEATEIMRAASARWQQPSDTNEVWLTSSPSQRQASGGANWREVDAEELYNIRAQEMARQQLEEEQAMEDQIAEQMQQQIAGPPTYGYQHSRQPATQLLLQQREQFEYWQRLHRQKQLAEQAQRLAYADVQAHAEQHVRSHFPGAAPSPTRATHLGALAQPQEQAQPPLDAPPDAYGVFPPSDIRPPAAPTFPAADARPAIPPLPQAPIAMHAPRPQRSSPLPYASHGASPTDSTLRGAAADADSGMLAPAAPALHVVNADGEELGDGADTPTLGQGEAAAASDAPRPTPRSSSSAGLPIQRPDEDEDAEEDEDEDRPASTQSSDSDEMPQMKAVSYPGDEWMPRWDID